MDNLLTTDDNTEFNDLLQKINSLNPDTKSDSNTDKILSEYKEHYDNSKYNIVIKHVKKLVIQ